jgi:hypothetical protein
MLVSEPGSGSTRASTLSSGDAVVAFTPIGSTSTVSGSTPLQALSTMVK